MKKIIILFCCCLAAIAISSNAQTNFSTIFVNNINYTSGTTTINSGGTIVVANTAPVNIFGTANVDVRSGKSVTLKPGFKASSATSSKFHAMVEMDMAVMTPVNFNGSVGKYEKLEIGLQLPAAINKKINDYLNFSNTAIFPNNTATPPAGSINPYDPDQISIEATFTPPSGSNSTVKTIYGFYYREYTRPNLPVSIINDKWTEISTPYNWRIRFTPDIVSNNPWTCSIKITSPNGSFSTFQQNGITFNCVSSNNPGYVAVANSGYLKYSESGNTFFAIGMNIPYPNVDTWNTNQTTNPGAVNRIQNSYSGSFQNMASPSLYKKNLDYIQNLMSNGANFVRVGIGPWAYGLEWEKLGNYDKRQAHAWELDKVFETVHNNGQSNQMYVQLFLEDGGKFKLNSEYGTPYYKWTDNPYNSTFNTTGEIGATPFPEDFFNINNTNQNAIKYYKKRLRYFIARYGYSTNLAVVDFLSEMDDYGLFYEEKDGKGNVINPRDETHWYRKDINQHIRQREKDWLLYMINYIKNPITSNGLACNKFLFSTSFAGQPNTNDNPSSDPYTSSLINLTSGHYYNDNRNITLYRAGWTNLFRTRYNKPFIFGEIGASDIILRCYDLEFHNAVWSTAVDGSFGTALEWNMWESSGLRNSVFPPIATFFNSVLPTTPLGTNNYKAQVFPSNLQLPNRTSAPPIEAFALTHSSGGIGWVHNRSNWWGNLSDFQTPGNPCYWTDEKGLPVVTPTYLYNNEADPNISAPTASLTNQSFSIGGFAPNTSYTISWYSTRGQGGQVFPSTGSTVANSNLSGVLTIIAPTLGNDVTNPGDYAFKISLSTKKLAASNQIINTAEQNPALNVSVYPNPTSSGEIELIIISTTKTNLILYDVIGNIIWSKQNSAEQFYKVDITNQANGIYFLKVSDGNQIKMTKIIKQ